MSPGLFSGLGFGEELVSLRGGLAQQAKTVFDSLRSSRGVPSAAEVTSTQVEVLGLFPSLRRDFSGRALSMRRVEVVVDHVAKDRAGNPGPLR